MDRIDAMRAFVMVATESSFTRAAERLETSPQLISKYVSRLEQQLGVRLLNRTTRQLNLTEAGSYYQQRAQQLLSDFDDVENQLTDLHREARGQLRVSAPTSFAIRHLPPLLSDFQQAHPAVGIDLQLTDRKVDIVEEGFDIALRIGHLRSSSLIARRVAPVRLLLCAAPDYLAQYGTPRGLADLKSHRYLRYSYHEQDTTDALSRHLTESARASVRELVSNNGDVLVEAAIAGAGLALQPSFIAGTALQSGQLEVVLPEHEPAPMSLYAVYAHRQLLASKVRCFVDFLENYYGDPPYWDRWASGRS